MPSREIRTTLAIDGDKKFALAMKDAAREMRVMESELKLVAAEFKSTDDAQKYYSERSRILKDEVEHQEETVRALTKAVEESKEVFGKAARETNGYRIELNNAKSKLEDLRRASEQADKEVEEFGRDSKKVGRQIADGIGDGVEEAEDKMDGMFDNISNNLESLKGMAGVSIAGQIGSFVMDAAEAISGFVADNVDLNRRKSMLIHNAESYGVNAEEILELVNIISGATGDMDSAMEAASNLAAVEFASKEQRDATLKALLGVYMSSGGTLDVSQLAEGFLESINEGKPTGTLAEAYVKFAGMTSEEADNALAGAKDTNEKIEMATAYLTAAGMQTKWETYAANNAELLEYQKKQNELAIAWAELAEELTPVVTGIIDMTRQVVEAITKTVDDIMTLYDQLSNFLAIEEEKKFVDNPDVNTAEMYAEVGTPSDWANRTKEETLEILAKYDQRDFDVAILKNDIEAWYAAHEADAKSTEALTSSMNGLAEALETEKGETEKLATSVDELASANETEQKSTSVADLYREVGTPKEWAERTLEETLAILSKFDQNSFDAAILRSDIEAWYAMREAEKETQHVPEVVEETEHGGGAGKSFAQEVIEGLEEQEENATTAGRNLGVAFGNGANSVLLDMMASFNALLNQPAGMPGRYGDAGNGGGATNAAAANRGMAVLEIDGHTAGRLLYGGVSEEGARRTRTMITVG